MKQLKPKGLISIPNTNSHQALTQIQSLSMSQPIPVDILSDTDDPPPPPCHVTPEPKRQRIEAEPICDPPSVFVIEDTPVKQSNPTPDFVPETAGFESSDVVLVKCTSRFSHPDLRLSGISKLICLESDDESEKGLEAQDLMQRENSGLACSAEKYLDARSKKSGLVCDVESDLEPNPRLGGSSFSLRDENLQEASPSSSNLYFSGDGMTQVNDLSPEENDGDRNNVDKTSKSKATLNKDKDGKGNGKKRLTPEEKNRLMEDKKKLKEEEKLRKEALKAEAAEVKRLEKEKQKWEKGKSALKSIVAEVDTKIVEVGSIAGPLCARFAEKGLTYKITQNPIERSIIWNMVVPEELSQLLSKGTEVSYVLLVFEAEEFCNLISNGSLADHISRVQNRYPSHTICYLTNRLMSYINKREQIHYKNPEKSNGWKRPPVEEVLSKLTTHFDRAHSRMCIDEAELADHIVGLTSSLASCLFRKKLTRLSVNANGAILPKDCPDKNLIKKNTWLKALVAIPKVQPRFAVAIWKKYPTMRSLLSVYMDPNKSVHEKEFLLKDLKTKGLLGEDIRLGEVCSKRVYRILMAESGSIKTDEVELGADLFRGDDLIS